MTNAICYPKDAIPRRWPHFDAGWYVKMLMYGTFGPYTEDEALGLRNRRARSLGFMPSDEVFFVAEPTALEVMQFANGLGDT